MTSSFSHAENQPAGKLSIMRAGLASKFKHERGYNSLIFICLGLWFVAVQILYTLIDGPNLTTQNRASGFVTKMIFYGTIYLSFWLALSLIKFARSLGDKSLIAAVSQAYQKDPNLALSWVIRLALAMISYVLLMTNFMSVKTLIPEIMPFYLDTAAHQLDRFLFFGRDPWTLFSWMYEFPSLVVTVDRIYTAWIGLIVGVWIYCFTSRAMPLKRRYQYIISMLLLWCIAGNLMAIALSSAGPVYFEYFTGSTVYQPLMAHLEAIHQTHTIGAYQYSDILLTMYENKESRFAGISALPSLHCASSFMILILFWKNKIARFALIAFNIIIFIGSIILAWHYAVDGLIAYLAALLCWWLGGNVIRFIDKRNPA